MIIFLSKFNAQGPISDVNTLLSTSPSLLSVPPSSLEPTRTPIIDALKNSTPILTTINNISNTIFKVQKDLVIMFTPNRRVDRSSQSSLAFRVKSEHSNLILKGRPHSLSSTFGRIGRSDWNEEYSSHENYDKSMKIVTSSDRMQFRKGKIPLDAFIPMLLDE
ncbi:uncharacterized protein EAF01_011815 [Botrytis porri]|uniref:Uncharacterized protein n=1 Tax=Botrytis porri TaxID=87229 RepID=A0A4Z1L1W4_9HELO|nr:uncharacterized protein EAF01_011815 [Botrytis porri]KAF7882035.1 hypothetical protein EAF01_011815 [Botrytis porri]TGO90774.1 hypothetical protein BPOR_0051g00090 [Botrytis porri]